MVITIVTTNLWQTLTEYALQIVQDSQGAMGNNIAMNVTHQELESVPSKINYLQQRL